MSLEKTEKSEPPSGEPESGLWRAVLVALEDNLKTARLIAILTTIAVGAAIAHGSW